MAGVPQIIDQIVQFTGATGAEWSNVLVPVPDKMVILDADGNIKVGNGTTLWVDLPILFNATTIINYGTELNSKASAIHAHDINTVNGLPNALDTLTAAVAEKTSLTDVNTAIAAAVTDPASPVVTELNKKVNISNYTVDQTAINNSISAKVSTSTYTAGLATKANTAGAVLTSPTVVDERLTSYNLGTISSGTVTINTLNGNSQRLQVGGNISINFNWPTSGDSAVLLRVTNGGSAVLSISGIQFISSDGSLQSSPNASLQSSGIDFIMFWYVNGTAYGKVIR